MSLRAEKLIVSLAIQSVITVVFLWIESVNASRIMSEPAWLVTPLDRSLPLVPGSVWLYISWYASPAVLLMLRREDFRRAAAAVLAGFLVCAVGYVLVPVMMNRPSLDDREGVSATVLRAVYAIDRPRNVFPSFHATLCATLLAVGPGPRRLRFLLGGWVSAICLSCVLTKQHYALDVVAGLGVGAVAVAAVDTAKRWSRAMTAGGTRRSRPTTLARRARRRARGRRRDAPGPDALDPAEQARLRTARTSRGWIRGRPCRVTVLATGYPPACAPTRRRGTPPR